VLPRTRDGWKLDLAWTATISLSGVAVELKPQRLYVDEAAGKGEGGRFCLEGDLVTRDGKRRNYSVDINYPYVLAVKARGESREQKNQAFLERKNY